MDKSPKRTRTRPKEVRAKMEKLFAANKHLFDMSCDLCPTIFETFSEGIFFCEENFS